MASLDRESSLVTATGASVGIAGSGDDEDVAGAFTGVGAGVVGVAGAEELEEAEALEEEDDDDVFVVSASTLSESTEPNTSDEYESNPLDDADAAVVDEDADPGDVDEGVADVGAFRRDGWRGVGAVLQATLGTPAKFHEMPKSPQNM